MSKQLEIYINGTRLNYLDRDGFPLSFSMSIDAAENPSKVTGNFSKRVVSFPGDGETGLFFQEWINSSRINPTAASRLPCRVDVDGITVFSGIAQLEDATGIGYGGGRRLSEHRVSLVGNNAAWFSDLQFSRIKDLGLLPVHELSGTYVGAHDNADPDTETHGYFLARGRDWESASNVRLYELTPFLFIRPILVEAFRLIGYKFESDFFDTNLGSRLILPVPFRELGSEFVARYEVAQRDAANTIVSLGGGIWHYKLQGNEVDYDIEDNYDPTTGEFTAPFSGKYLVETCVVYGFGPPAIFGVQINGVTQSPILGVILVNRFGWVYQNTYFLEAGDTVRLVTNRGDITDGAHMVITPSFNWEEGTTVSLEHYGNPEWVVSDMILGLTHAFGLVWDTDFDAQTVRAEPRDRYRVSYRNPDTIEYHDGFYKQTDRDDRTTDIDLQEEATYRALNDPKEEHRMAYKADSTDPNLDAQDDGATMRTFDGLYRFPPGRFQRGRTDYENRFFAATLHFFDIEVRHDSSAFTAQMPLLRSEKIGTATTDPTADFEPRLLYFAGRRGGIDGYVNLEDFGQYDPPTAFMVNYNDPDGYDPCLSFGSETLLNGTVVPGLIQTFHLQHMKRLEAGKQVEEWMRWTEAEIIDLSFRRKILIDDQLYLLQKLDGYKPVSTGPIKTLLLADAVPEPEDLDKIESSVLTGYAPKGEQ